METNQLGLSSITALAQFIPTSEEIDKVTKFVKEQAANANKTPTATQTPEAAKSDAEIANKPLTTFTAKRMHELKIGKAEQYIYFLARVRTLNPPTY
jgi:hypothetical protein